MNTLIHTGCSSHAYTRILQTYHLLYMVINLTSVHSFRGLGDLKWMLSWGSSHGFEQWKRNGWIQPHRPPAGPQRPSEHVQDGEVQKPMWRDSSGSCVCFVMRALAASGYKWGDIDDTSSALLVHTSKFQMNAPPRATCRTVPMAILKTSQDVSVFL